MLLDTYIQRQTVQQQYSCEQQCSYGSSYGMPPLMQRRLKTEPKPAVCVLFEATNNKTALRVPFEYE